VTTDNETQWIAAKTPELNRLICADQSRARLDIERAGRLEILININHFRLSLRIIVRKAPIVAARFISDLLSLMTFQASTTIMLLVDRPVS
jgi:hypothetical protein